MIGISGEPIKDCVKVDTYTIDSSINRENTLLISPGNTIEHDLIPVEFINKMKEKIDSIEGYNNVYTAHGKPLGRDYYLWDDVKQQVLDIIDQCAKEGIDYVRRTSNT